MQSSICHSCRRTLRLRLQYRLSHLQTNRRTKTSVPSKIELPSYYYDTVPPTSRQLAAASHFFKNHRPNKVWTANEWRHSDKETGTGIPEVLFIGRSNVGKSSLLNALLNDPSLNRISRTPGFTKVMHAYGLSEIKPVKSWRTNPDPPTDNILHVIDSPGYGHASRSEWGAELTKYIQRRQNLRRVFVLIDSRHGVKKSDMQVFDVLQRSAISYQVVATKCDGIGPPKKRQDLLDKSFLHIRGSMQSHDSRTANIALGEIVAVGYIGDGMWNNRTATSHMQGVSALQYAVLRATGLNEYAFNKFSELEESKTFDHTPIRRQASTVQLGMGIEPPSYPTNGLFDRQPLLKSAKSGGKPATRSPLINVQRDPGVAEPIDERWKPFPQSATA